MAALLRELEGGACGPGSPLDSPCGYALGARGEAGAAPPASLPGSDAGADAGAAAGDTTAGGALPALGEPARAALRGQVADGLQALVFHREVRRRRGAGGRAGAWRARGRGARARGDRQAPARSAPRAHGRPVRPSPQGYVPADVPSSEAAARIAASIEARAYAYAVSQRSGQHPAFAGGRDEDPAGPHTLRSWACSVAAGPCSGRGPCVGAGPGLTHPAPLRPPPQCRVAEAGGGSPDSIVRVYAKEASTLLLAEVEKYTRCAWGGGREWGAEGAGGGWCLLRRREKGVGSRVQPLARAGARRAHRAPTAPPPPPPAPRTTRARAAACRAWWTARR
jgi:hypothetical protein